MLRTISPKQGTPVADFYTRGNGSGKKDTIGGITFWLKGRSPTWNKDETSPHRERAAYLIDKMLGLNLVPHTILMMNDGYLVSAQKFIKGRRPDYTDKKPTMMEIFDWLIGNTDRHGGNWLIEGEKVWAIDNAYSFDNSTRGYRFNEEPKMEELSATDRNRLTNKIQSVLSDTQKLHKRLDCLIGEEETGYLISRLGTILRALGEY